MSIAQDERAGLAADLSRLGPDAPTLCKGWTARDLLTPVSYTHLTLPTKA